MVDAIGYEVDVVEALRGKIGSPKASVIEYRIPTPSLLELLLGEMRGQGMLLGESRWESGIERLVRRRGPMALYLWTGY